jgi:hypothetical protein
MWWEWEDVVPKTVAVRQRAWERRQLVIRGRDAGLTYKEISLHLGLSIERTRQIHKRWEWCHETHNFVPRDPSTETSPVELYFQMQEPDFVKRPRIMLQRMRDLSLHFERDRDVRRIGTISPSGIRRDVPAWPPGHIASR